MLLAHGQLFVGRRGGDHARTDGLADLDCRDAHAAGRAQHEHGLARFQLAAVDHRMVRSAVGQRKGRGGLEVDARRHRHDRGGGRLGLRGKRAIAQVGDDLVARLDMGDACAHRVDHAGQFGAGAERQGRLGLVFVLDDEHIREVDGGRLHVDDHFARARHQVGQGFHGQRIRGAPGFAKYGFHLVSVRYVWHSAPVKLMRAGRASVAYK
ncbi:hypothetical protein D9M70_472920 [compost metagenome]